MKTEQIIEEREDSVKMKMRFKRFLSGFMAVATLASEVLCMSLLVYWNSGSTRP